MRKKEQSQKYKKKKIIIFMFGAFGLYFENYLTGNMQRGERLAPKIRRPGHEPQPRPVEDCNLIPLMGRCSHLLRFLGAFQCHQYFISLCEL